MPRTSEFPDSGIVCLAEQFLDTALLLLRNVPKVVAPSPIRVNAAFAIELFLKSLNSSWKLHSLKDELGIDDAFAITSASNRPGHKLRRLFEALPDSIKGELSSAFARSSLRTTYRKIEDALSVYSNTFVSERYAFEGISAEHDSKPLAEIVAFAEFFRDCVLSMPIRRFETNELEEDIDARFSISITFKLRDGSPERRAFSATEFFDSGVQVEYSPDEWHCHLPWEKLAEIDYLSLSLAEKSLLEWLQLDIIEHSSQKHRRIVDQFWGGGNSLASEWNGRIGQESVSQLIFEVVEKDTSLHQIVKLSASPQAMKVVSHGRFSIDSPDDVGEWIDCPLSPIADH